MLPAMADKNLPPGSLGLPFLGETLEWVRDPFTFMETRFNKYGPIFKTRLLGDNMIAFGTPESFTAFLDTNNVTREGGTPPHIEALVGKGTLPFVDGPHQLRNKRMMLSAFRPDPMRGYIETASRVFDRYFQKWETMGEFEWFPELESLTIVLFDALFAGANPDTENKQLRADLDVFLRGILGLPLPVGPYPKAMRAKEGLMRYLRGAVSERRAKPGNDAITHLIRARDEDGNAFTDEEIVAEMIHVFFAGYAGVSGGFSYAVIALAQNPLIRDRAREEVLSRTSEQVTLEELSGATYLQQIWKEILRFYPAVPHTFMGRTIRDFEVGGFHIPAGWKATGLIYSQLHDERIYKEPNRFDPDRFSPERAEDKEPNSFVAQGGGRAEHHRCLGESISALMVKQFMCKLLRDYSWDLLDTPQIAREFPAGPRGGVPAKLNRMSGTFPPT